MPFNLDLDLNRLPRDPPGASTVQRLDHDPEPLHGHKPHQPFAQGDGVHLGRGKTGIAPGAESAGAANASASAGMQRTAGGMPVRLPDDDVDAARLALDATASPAARSLRRRREEATDAKTPHVPSRSLNASLGRKRSGDACLPGWPVVHPDDGVVQPPEASRPAQAGSVASSGSASLVVSATTTRALVPMCGRVPVLHGAVDPGPFSTIAEPPPAWFTAPPSRDALVVPAGSCLRGDVSAPHVWVLGRVRGHVNATGGVLVVAAGAEVDGSVEGTAAVVVAGRVRARNGRPAVIAHGRLDIACTAHIAGAVQHNVIALYEGARVDGLLTAVPPRHRPKEPGRQRVGLASALKGGGE